jgi:adenylate kinase family enzyme
MIKEKYGLIHFSCGDLLRECVASEDSDPKLKEEINTMMKEGKIVPVEITCKLLKAAMDKAGGKVIE